MRYAFVLGGGSLGEPLGGELCGDFLSRYGKGGHEEKSPIYGELRTLVWGGKLPAGSLGDKAMKGQRVIQWGWSDMKACWRTKMKA
ncbi:MULTISPECIES: hypothetical protein [unclassified Bartonella]|uniref:hypothetical protein n=1 Tax=unclassified Bartonella TaxID=2645622 RepID=UPI0035D029D7